MATAPLDIEQAVREAAEQRRAKLTPPPTKAAVPSFVPKDVAPIISSAAERHGVPADELALIARQESNFNPRAVNRESGAEGMYQQHPPAHPNYRLGTGDPAYQTDYAAARYRELLNRYSGDREKATTAWYGGQGTIDRAIARNPEAWQLALPPRTGKYNADTNNLRASLGALSPVQQAQAQSNPAVVRTYGAKPYEPPAEQPRPARALTPPPMDPAAAAELRTEVDRAAWNRKNILEKGASLIARPLYRGWQQAGQTSNIVTSELGLESPEEASADIVARTQNLREAGTPFYAEEARKRAEGKGVAGSLAEMLRDPRAALDVSLESLTQSIASLIAGAAAGFGAGLAGAGPIGAAVGTGAGAGLGSFAVDYGSEILGAMQESGVDLTDAESIQAALEDPELMHKARVGAVAHGLPVAAFDALSAGMASKLVRPTTALLGKKVILETGEQVTKATAVSNLAAGIAELAQQTTFGGSGEALGQMSKSYVETGKAEIYDPYGVAAEIVGEIPSGAVETTTGLGRDYMVRQKKLPPPPAGPAQAATEAAVGAGAVQPPPEGGPPGGPPPGAAPQATGPKPKPGPVPAGVLYGDEPPEAGAAPPPPPPGAPPAGPAPTEPPSEISDRQAAQIRLDVLLSGVPEGVAVPKNSELGREIDRLRTIIDAPTQETPRVEQPTVQPVPIQPVGLAQAEGQPAQPAGAVEADRPTVAAPIEPIIGAAQPAVPQTGLTPPPSQEKPSEEAQPAPVAGLPAEEARPEASSVQGSAEPAPAAGNAPQDAAQAQGLRPVFNGKVETQRGNKIAAPPRRDTPNGAREYKSWLLKSARKEAQGANDQVALDAFHGIKPNKMTDDDFSDLSNYLFGEEDVEFDLGGPRAPRKAMRAPERGDERRDSILQFLAKTRGHGRLRRGLDLDEAVLQGIDPHKLSQLRGSGIYRAFHKGGMSFDQAAELLAEAGYPVHSTNREGLRAPDLNRVLDLVSQELAGNRAYSDRYVMPKPIPTEDYDNAGFPPPLESEAAVEAQQISLVQQAINIDPDATEAILNEVGDDPRDLEDALRSFIESRRAPVEDGAIPELESPGSTEEPDWGITEEPAPVATAPAVPTEPAAPQVPEYEPAGVGQQAVIPGMEVRNLPPKPLELEGGMDLTPPLDKPGERPDQTQIDMTGAAGTVSLPTPPPRPVSPIGTGLFSQPVDAATSQPQTPPSTLATPKVDETAAQGARARLLASQGQPAAPVQPAAPAPQATATAAVEKNGFQEGSVPGERIRVGSVKATGGIMLEKENEHGRLSMYVGTDGSLVDVAGINLIGDSRSKIWNPPTPEARAEGERLLLEIGKTPLHDPKRAQLKEQLKQLVLGDTGTGSPAASAPQATATAVEPTATAVRYSPDKDIDDAFAMATEQSKPSPIEGVQSFRDFAQAARPDAFTSQMLTTQGVDEASTLWPQNPRLKDVLRAWDLSPSGNRGELATRIRTAHQIAAQNWNNESLGAQTLKALKPMADAVGVKHTYINKGQLVEALQERFRVMRAALIRNTNEPRYKETVSKYLQGRKTELTADEYTYLQQESGIPASEFERQSRAAGNYPAAFTERERAWAAEQAAAKVAPLPPVGTRGRFGASLVEVIAPAEPDHLGWPQVRVRSEATAHLPSRDLTIRAAAIKPIEPEATPEQVMAAGDAEAEAEEDTEDSATAINERSELISLPSTSKTQERPALELRVAPSGNGFRYMWFAYTPESQFVAQWTEETYKTRQDAIDAGKKSAAEDALSSLQIKYTTRAQSIEDGTFKKNQDVKDLEAIIENGGLTPPDPVKYIADWREAGRRRDEEIGIVPRRTAHGDDRLESDMSPKARAAVRQWFRDETKSRDLRRIREAMEIYQRLDERNEEGDEVAATAIYDTINAFFENQTSENAAAFDDAVWSGLQKLTGEEDPDPAALLENEVFATAQEAGQLVFDTVDPRTASFDAEELNTAFGMVEFRRPVASTFPTPPKGARVDHIGTDRKGQKTGVAAGPFVTPEQAVATIDGWKAHALAIGAEKKHGQQVIVSLFDRTGQWAQPWKDAGFKVVTADVQTGQDLMNFGQWMDEVEALIDEGYEISGVLAAPPCTSFAVSGNRYWEEQHNTADADMVAQKYGEWAAQHFEKPIDYANTLAAVVKLFVAQANPRFYAMENPLGRIREQQHLPYALLSFNPHAYGDPYTKKTGLWGEFNPNLPLNNIEPTKGSLIHTLRGDDPVQKAMRSETPLGFAYAFFEANYPAVAEMLPEGETFTPPIGTFSPVMEGESATPETETPAPGQQTLDVTTPPGAKTVPAAPNNLHIVKTSYPSGMNRPGDFDAAMAAESTIGVELSELSMNMLQKVAEAANRGVPIFVDSGAFSAHRRGERIDMKATMDKYVALMRMLDDTGMDNLSIVAPDIVGEPGLTLGMIGGASKLLSEIGHAGVNIIYPVQTSEGMSATYFVGRLTEILLNATPNQGLPPMTLGIPSKAKAMPDAQFRAMLEKYRPSQIHILGAADRANVEARLRAIDEVLADSEVTITLDANVLRSTIANQAGIESRQQAIEDMLRNKQPERTEVVAGNYDKKWHPALWYDVASTEYAPSTEWDGRLQQYAHAMNQLAGQIRSILGSKPNPLAKRATKDRFAAWLQTVPFLSGKSFGPRTNSLYKHLRAEFEKVRVAMRQRHHFRGSEPTDLEIQINAMLNRRLAGELGTLVDEIGALAMSAGAPTSERYIAEAMSEPASTPDPWPVEELPRDKPISEVLFEQDERVVVNSGELAGRHGRVVKIETVTWAGYLGSNKQTNTSYVVETDAGAIETYHPADLTREEGDAPADVMKDVLYNGQYRTPAQMEHMISLARKERDKAQGKIDRARSKESIEKHTEKRGLEESRLRQLEDAFDKWRLQPAPPRTVTVGQTTVPVRPNSIVTDETAEAVRERLRNARNQLNVGLDPQVMADGVTLAVYHIERGAHTFAAYVRAMVADMGDWVKPYVRQWYLSVFYDPQNADIAPAMTPAQEVVAADIEEILSGESNEISPERVPAGDRTDAATQDELGAPSVPDAGGRQGGVSVQGSEGTAGEGVRSGVRTGVPDVRAPARGERGDQPVSGGERESAPTGVPTRSDVGERGADDGQSGLFTDEAADLTTEEDDDALARRIDLDVKKELQRKAESIPVTLGDADNIADTLPVLFPTQHEDVLFGERRLAGETNYGVLFANGTGTGKTFVGAAIVKRMVKAGKAKNVIIVVPDQEVADGWIKAGALINLPINKLSGISDPGKGVSITTYANFGQNNAIVGRHFDVIVSDESHNLMKSKQGEQTEWLRRVRALALHPRGVETRVQMQNPELWGRIVKLEEQINAKGGMTGPEGRERLAELQRLRMQFRQLVDQERPYVTSMQGAKRPRAIFLSATPFAYERNVQWAEGFLLDFPTSGPNVEEVGPFGAYAIENFGWRVRYGKLTEPGPAVDRSIMQREWNMRMRRSGAMSVRMLDVESDYERKFVLVESKIGQAIDEGLEFLRNGKDGKYRRLYSIVNDQFDFLKRRRLLESLKAREAIPYIKKQHALGRKVVAFYDYTEGGGFRLFHFPLPATRPTEDSSLQKLYDLIVEFNAERPDLVALDTTGESPLVTLLREFPGAAQYNGVISKTRRKRELENFNADSMPEANLILANKASNAGWSAHDVTGAHQRILINLGLPTAPVEAIQQEGRIYRVGQATDAIFRYFNTGTNWERSAFAATIAYRASTAENLAMGEQARGLRDSFVEAFEAAEFEEPSAADGKGSKARDRELTAAITPFDRAKTYFFGQRRKTQRDKSAEGTDYFATPEPLGFKMVEWADVRPGETALEPSAGHGAIARWFPDRIAKTAIEPSLALSSRLALAVDTGTTRIVNERFEDHNIVNKYDVIAMNSPYGTAGKTAMEHIIKAAGHLKDHGRIVAIVSDGPAMQKRLNDWLYGEVEKPVKPLGDTPVGPVYKGDTITTSVSWIPRGVLTRKDASGGLYVRTKPGEEQYVQAVYINGIEPTGKRVEMVRPGEGIHQVAEILLPSVTFTNAATTVNTKVIVLDKLPENANPPQPISRDLREATTFKQLFDALERVTVPDRVKERKDEVETPENPQAKPTKKPAGVAVTFKTREMQHTRDKTTIYYASHQERVPNTQLKLMKQLADKYRGYWHSAGRFNPEAGWRFDSAENRQAFMDEVMGKEVPQAARRAPEHGQIKGDVPQEITSAATSRKQVAAAIKKIEWEPGTINADIGAGKFPDTTKALAAEGVRNIPYDPFNRTEDENFDAILEIANGRRRADTATVLNVLNVIQEPEARDNVIRRAAKAIKDDGVAYFQVYEGDGSGTPGPTRDGWQENRRAESYVREIEQHFDNVIRRGQVIEARDPIRGPLSDKWHDGTDLVFARTIPASIKPATVLRVQPVRFGMSAPTGRAVTVYRNPSPTKLLNELRINVRAGQPPFEYRWARSSTGDVYVWDASEAAHYEMANGIEKTGETSFFDNWTSQNFGFIELDGRRLIASDNHGNNDVDIGTVLPEAAAAARRTGFERTASYDGQAAMDAARKLDAWATQVAKHLEGRKAAAKAARIEVVRSLDELRQILDETTETVRSGTKGVYIRDGNRIYLVAEELETLDEADRIFTHEAIGHMAMERYAVMADAVKAAIQLRDTDETIRNLWAQVRVDEHDKTEYQQAKEVVARLAEGTIEHPLIDRMVAALKRLIRSWGIKLDFSKRELRGMIASAARQQLREKPSPYESKAERASRKEYELLANRREPGTPQEARNVTAQAMRRGAPLDTLMRLPFQLLGMLNEHGEFTLGVKASRKLEHYLKNAKFDQGGGPVREAVNLILEKARWGLLDRYGVPESAVQAGNKAESEKRNIQHQGMVLLRKILTTVTDPLESKILQEMLTGETLDDARFSQLRDEIRAAIEALSLDALNLGLISRESYERNKGSYLHRVYLETEKQRGGRGGLSEWMATMLHGRRARIQGNELKGRGMFWDVTQERLLRDIDKENMDLPGGVKMVPGRADPQFIGQKFRVLDLVKTPGEGTATLEGFEAGTQPAKLVNRVWWPKDFPVPAKYADYVDRGVFEIRDVVGNKFVMWRDFTKEERNQMGEILDVRYTLARMYQLFAQDISSAKYFRELSRDPNVTWQEEGPPPKALLAKVRGNDPFKPMPTRDVMSLIGYEWVQVPKTTIAETGGVPKWGDLAGKYIRVEVWKDLNEYDRMNERGPWVRLLEQWKLNKTARNPVVHMNNMISNLLLADMVDVTIRDLIEGFQLYMENGGQGEARQRAERYGAFGYGYADQELNKHLRDTLATMVAENRAGLYEGFAGRLKFFDRFGSIVSEGLALVSKADDKMVDAYAAEDDVFRMATFVKYERMGFSPDEAAQMARDEFMNYNIRAPWINTARRSVLPFLAYSYRAIPVIANAIMRRPWKLAKYALLAEMANVLAYALTEGDEDWERRTMAKRDQGRSWMGGTPYMMRLPFNDQNGNPMFIDIRRWIPGGDVFDLNQEGVVPVPAWLHFGGPLVIAAEIVLNRSAFTGEDIVDPLTDDTGDAAKAYAGHLWKSAAPSAPYIPGSWYWDKIGRSLGGLDAMGRELSTPQALASAVGVKARSHDPIMQVRATRFDYEKKVRALRAELRVAARQQSRRIISESDYKAIERDITEKLALANEDFVKRVQE